MIANIKSGQLARRRFIFQVREKRCEAFLDFLWNEGLIIGYAIEKQITDPKKDMLKILLKYYCGRPAIDNIQLISKPSRQICYSIKQLWKLSLNNSLMVFSTTKGLKSLTDCKKLRIGGELLAIIT